MPFSGTPKVTQWYGEDPDYYRQFGVAGHNGIDFSLITGITLKAVAGGRVTRARKDTTGYGWHVMVNHGWGQSIEAHMSRIDVVEQQDVVTGQTLGLSGNTGNSTGPHLHFGLRIYGQSIPTMNDWVDPKKILGLNGGPNPVEDVITLKMHQEVLPLVPGTAFMKWATPLGLLPASDEFDVTVDNVHYKAQAFRKPSDTANIYVVYAVLGDWGNLHSYVTPN